MRRKRDIHRSTVSPFCLRALNDCPCVMIPENDGQKWIAVLALRRSARILQLLVDNRLPETTASWTIDIGFAKTFKGAATPKVSR